jgi:integrase
LCDAGQKLDYRTYPGRDHVGADWLLTRHDLRPTTHAGLATTLSRQVLPRFGATSLLKITNGAVRSWVAHMVASGLSPATVRKAVFALRQCLAAAVSDRRIALNPAVDVPLPAERSKPPRFLAQFQVERLAEVMADRYRALVLVGAYGGLRWGEAVGLTRANVDVLRSRIIVETTAIEVRGKVSLGQEPKTRRSKRTVPVARSVMRRLEQHLADHVGAEPDALVFTASRGGSLFRSTFAREAWRPAVKKAGLDGFTFHGLRHSFSRSWSPPGATSARCRSGRVTTVWRSP